MEVFFALTEDNRWCGLYFSLILIVYTERQDERVAFHGSTSEFVMGRGGKGVEVGRILPDFQRARKEGLNT
jgi:hypothetical protein